MVHQKVFRFSTKTAPGCPEEFHFSVFFPICPWLKICNRVKSSPPFSSDFQPMFSYLNKTFEPLTLQYLFFFFRKRRMRQFEWCIIQACSYLIRLSYINYKNFNFNF